ncbi:putative vitellogenin receptor [Vanessa cardui]|uniref:putative vitellogenin receptor n=1 Tax=Vanessa cardui TaxID=171605 RepID=UPI001F1386AF|nr:putative vitellogenin receptor [Vanessa cardui]
MAVLLIILMWLVTCQAEFNDEMQSFDAECLVEGAFFCLGGGCISQDKYCDGNRDCGDGSDENFCVNHAPDALYCNETHQFLCGDGHKCVPSSWVCNNETDCNDGSDEVNCTMPIEHENSTCKGFLCDGGKRCISHYWTCDGHYDCDDKTDEDYTNNCRHKYHPNFLGDLTPCDKSEKISCLDKSYCLTPEHMCDGLADCRDGSDEGKFCDHWHSQCTNFTCPKNTKCKPQRTGPTCMCLPSYSIYNDTTKKCELVNECEHVKPSCSQTCHNGVGYFTCSCEEGYTMDRISKYLCFAPDPEALLFFSTKNDIRYVKVKSKEEVVVATGIKQAHGVSFDGNYLYWVETAQGHQAIMRAQLHNMAESKQVLAAFGIEDPGDIAVDFLGDNIYFSDTARGIISVCRSDGSLCTTLPANTKNPRFVTLEPRQGLMYWADWHDKAVIMSARMDGSQSDVLVGNLSSFATGLALDSLNGRLYFVDQTVKVVRLKDKVVYFLFQEPFHHPYSLAVFENTVYWSDWTTNTILTSDKLHGTSFNRNVLHRLDMPVFDMHLYHPILMNNTLNPCNHNLCAICLVTSNTTHVCACPDTMEMIGNRCQVRAGERPQFVLVGAGAHVTRVRRDVIGNPELHDTHLDVGRLQALAYDNYRDTLYIYDSHQKSVNYMNMSDFTLGITHVLVNKGLENIVDMDYDFVSDTLYLLDAGRRLIEVVSLTTRHSAIIYYFTHEEIPMSLCVLPDYGKLLVAVLESDENNEIHIDSITLDGEDRQHVLLNNIIGPNIRIRYSSELNLVYISDEGRGVIDVMHPEGKGREVFREVLTTIGSVAATSTHLFWTDRHSSRLYWADVHEATHRIRRIELSIFPNDTNLHVLATTLPPRGELAAHACSTGAPCSHVCVQTRNGNKSGHRCVCSPGFKMVNGDCLEIIHCRSDEMYCHRSNQCFLETAKCDGVKDCKYGEDEEGCVAPATQSPLFCKPDQTNCHGVCISKNDVCKGNTTVVSCAQWEWACSSGALCVSRTLACDGRADCPDGSDESPAACDTGTCFHTEFMCGSGNCIPITWHCDGGEDCADGSDEINCESNQYLCPEHLFQCKNNTCIDLSKRCDGKYDCEDHDDEDDCEMADLFEESENVLTCMPWEYTCEHNSSICLPMTARCNGKVDCPGGTDEAGCYLHCLSYKEFFYSCKQELMCLPQHRWCDGHVDCGDGSDESAEACAMMNKTLAGNSTHQVESCSKGYRCDGGQCVEWARVCDRVRDCADGSDEGRLCDSPCARDTCEHSCQPSPRGPHCTCPHGYTANGSRCHDVDECALGTCSHVCHNLPGSFVCSCHAGYALRSDRRSCKAVRGRLSVVYTKRSSVWSMTSHIHSLRYHDKDDKEISDVDVAVRSGKIYVASSQAGKLVEVNLHDKGSQGAVITNIGNPTKVSADWVTGNVYFSDGRSHIRVCHFRHRRCARVLQLPSTAKVDALVVDPANYKMFFCVSEGTEAIVRSASLSGKNVSDLTSVASCSGLAADSFSKMVYIASEPSSIMQVDYDGKVMLTIFSNNPTIHSPQHLELFEDHLYLLSGTHLIRCLLFSSKTCSPYSHLPNGTAFVIQHESVQRDDVHDDCETITCSNICVMESMGPQCVCHDGTWTSDGTCPQVEDSELARFEGVVIGTGSTRTLPVVVVTLVVVLFALYVCMFVRRFTKKKNAANYMQVRYQNTPDGMTHLSNPILDMPEAGYIINGMGHEFVNPLQFVRNMWQESFYKKSKPIGTSGLSFDTHQDLSDTESDLDVRESRRMIKE